MFGISFSELLLVALIALLVLGPERLPGAARTAGLWIGRIKRSFNAIKTEVEREIGADEIRRQLHNEQILQLEREMQATKNDLMGQKPADSEQPATAQAQAAEQPPAEPQPAPSQQQPTTASSQDNTPKP
ncbi:Sec-independent protein translocase protein TatB [Ectopseudomonas mendocina]|jgi:sec-independent protein translocase protein TatB|uniref:Sec-independent protein translocase protein TatB n=1 Tax=Ectopseudomonas mendocina TaxID=300 RepID=A0A2R3QLL0_ECTME|nr:Sec-independent protein translocase protein TatB [Pseudomonas mendocina]AVO52617.1 twin-arginine translocase subunit TatB [Pseudomonas mendocina]